MDNNIKQREIVFCPLHPDRDQASSAASLLLDTNGVLHARPLSHCALEVHYDIHETSLEALEEALAAAGYHLDNSLLHKLKRALVYYTEEVQRDNLGCDRGSTNCTRDVFVSRYSRISHGCRDPRPDHWRHYL